MSSQALAWLSELSPDSSVKCEKRVKGVECSEP
jgi:hypothetical protein